MQTSLQDKVSKSAIAAAGYLVVVPVICYAMKFTWDLGYSTYFQIPPQLTSFSLGSTFSSMGPLLFALLGSLQLANLVVSRASKDPGLIALQNLSVIIVGAIILVTSPVSQVRSLGWVSMVIGVILAVRHFGLPVINHRNTQGYFEKVEAHVAAVKRRSDTLLDYLFGFSVYRLALIPVLAIYVGLVIFKFGAEAAVFQDRFFVSANDESWVVLRFLDDRAVFAHVVENRMDGQIVLRDLGDEDLVLKQKHLGPIDPLD